MSWVGLLVLALALAMDAFAVAVAAGLSLSRVTGKHVFRLAFHFGLFQALMLFAGWAAGTAIRSHIMSIDHWVAFGLLGFVGGKMIFEAVRGGEEDRPKQDPTTGWNLILLSVATSIDALAVGLSLAMIGAPIAIPALVIGVVAAVLTMIGMLIGRSVGRAWGRRVEILGGVILLAIGIKILLDHILTTVEVR
ncbi:MAG: manganese efflux pump MntP family protein [Pseudomonadota bacterium]